MNYIGILPDGTEVRLPQPVRVRLSREEDAPADGFSGVFPLQAPVGNITSLRIYGRDGSLCFDGITDDWKVTRADGNFLTLTARSRAALLLDNEAIPQTYCMPSLSTIFQRHIQPYGFTGFRGSKKIFCGALSVTKGMSEWQAAEQFCRQFLHVTPRIQDGVFDASGEIPSGQISFGTGGVPYSALVIHNRYAEKITELLAQGGTDGTYFCVARDTEAGLLGIRRRRCLTLGQNAKNVLRTAQKKSFSILLTCPGEITARLLQSAQFTEVNPELPRELYVAGIEYVLGTSGEFTQFALRRRG